MRSILFDHIPDAGLSVHQDLNIEFISQLLSEPHRELAFIATQSTRVSFQLKREKNNVLVVGQGIFELTHPCIRCLRNLKIRHPLALDIQLEKPDLIPLDSLLREELFLELPLYPYCSDFPPLNPNEDGVFCE